MLYRYVFVHNHLWKILDKDFLGIDIISILCMKPFLILLLQESEGDIKDFLQMKMHMEEKVRHVTLRVANRILIKLMYQEKHSYSMTL